jgi:hypothetical protein
MSNARVTQQYVEAATTAETRNARVTQQYVEAACLLDSGTTVELDPTSLSLAIYSATVDIAASGTTVSVAKLEIVLSVKVADASGPVNAEVPVGSLSISTAQFAANAHGITAISVAAQEISLSQNAVTTTGVWDCAVSVMENWGRKDFTSLVNGDAEGSGGFVNHGSNLSIVTNITVPSGGVTVYPYEGSYFFAYISEGASFPSKTTENPVPYSTAVIDEGGVVFHCRMAIRSALQASGYDLTNQGVYLHDNRSYVELSGTFRNSSGTSLGDLPGTAGERTIRPTADESGWEEVSWEFSVPSSTARVGWSVGRGNGFDADTSTRDTLCLDKIEMWLERQLPTSLSLSVHEIEAVVGADTAESVNRLQLGLNQQAVTVNVVQPDADVGVSRLYLNMTQRPLVVSVSVTVPVSKREMALARRPVTPRASSSVTTLSPLSLVLELKEAEIDGSANVAVESLVMVLAVLAPTVFAGAVVQVGVHELLLSVKEVSTAADGGVLLDVSPLVLSIGEVTASTSLVVDAARQELALTISDVGVDGSSNVYPDVLDLLLSAHESVVGGGGFVSVNVLDLSLGVFGATTVSDVALSLATLPLSLAVAGTTQMYSGSVSLGILTLRVRTRHPTAISAFPDQPIVIFFREEKTTFERVAKTDFLRAKVKTVFKDDITGTNFKRGKSVMMNLRLRNNLMKRSQSQQILGKC